MTIADLPVTARAVPGTDVGVSHDGTRLFLYREQSGWVPWLDWCPRVHAWGVDSRRRAWYMLEVRGESRRITADTLRDGTCWEEWPVSGYDSLKNRDRLAGVVRWLASGLDRDAGATATGWYDLHGTLTYVTADACITADGPASFPVDVVFDSRLDPYALPTPLTGDDLRDGIYRQFDLGDLAPLGITGSLTATVALSSLYSWFTEEAPDFSVLVYGESGLGKSELLTLYQNHFTPALNRRELTSMGSTGNFLRQLPHLARDAVCTLDDYAGGVADQAQELKQTRVLTELLHALGNGAGRGRLGKDLQARDLERPRGIAFVTGEKLPPSATRSTLARAVPLEVRTCILDDPALDRMQASRAVFGAVHAAYLQWQAGRGQHLRGGGLDELFRARRRYVRQTYSELARLHSRIPSNVAYLLLGYDQWLAFAEHADAITPEQRQVCYRDYEHAVVGEYMRFAPLFEDTDPPIQWAQSLAEVFASGLGHLEHAKGGPPATPHRFGWSRTTDDEKFVTARGVRLGYELPDGDLLILKDKAYQQVADLCAASETPITAGPTVVNKGLAKLGAIEVRTELRSTAAGTVSVQRYTPAVELGSGSLVRGIRIKRAWWDRLAADPDSPDDDQGGTPDPSPDPAAFAPACLTCGEPTDPALGFHPGCVDPTPDPASVEPAQKAPETAARAPASPPESDRGRTLQAVPDAPTDPPRAAQLAPRATGQRHAVVLARDGLWFPDAPDPVAVDLPASIAAAHALAAAYDARQLWVHPSVHELLGLPAEKTTGNPQAPEPHPWMTAPGYRVDPDGLAAWVHVDPPEEAGPRRAVVLCGYETRAPWRTASTGSALLAAVLEVESTLGESYYYSPNETTKALIRKKTSRGKTTLAPVDMPPPAATRAVRHLYRWSRPLLDEEEGTEWVHRYDVRQQQLATWGQKFGIGAAEHVADPAWTDATRRLPGYWLTEVCDGWRPDPRLPDLLDPWERTDEATAWLPTPTVELLLELGAPLRFTEAWLWRQARAWLQTTKKTLTQALTGLDTRVQVEPDESTRIALKVVKTMYTAQVGNFAPRERTGRTVRPDPLVRPDVRDLIIARAQANDYRRMRKIADRSGRYPIAIYADAVYYASDNPSGASGAPAGLEVGSGQGQYAHEVTVPMYAVREELGERTFIAAVEEWIEGKRR